MAGARLRSYVLLGASLLFYAWGGGLFVLHLLFLSVVHWLGGLGISGLRERRNRWALALTGFLVICDLGFIGYFKYASFLVGEIERVGGVSFGEGWKDIVLPIGISFFTFQAISYLLDVYWGRVTACRAYHRFALYLSMFPQLIAGPIVRYADVVEDLGNSRWRSSDEFASGVLRFCHGFSKKVLIADQVSPIVAAVFSSSGQIGTVEAWVGALAYTIQIYFDFSAYSDMAIGLGRMLGFRFPENFNRPYCSRSITEFWRRWHITLSSWFRDYLYIPIGGSRVSPARVYRNLLIVFVATAVWHGANWTFLIWGLWHGAWLIIEKAVLRSREGALAWARTILVVVVGWVMFRADSFEQGMEILNVMFLPGRDADAIVRLDTLRPFFWAQPLAAFILGILYMLLAKGSPWGLILDKSDTMAGRLLAYLSVLGFFLGVFVLVSGSVSPFLYFRF